MSDSYNPHTASLRKCLLDTENMIHYLEREILKNDDIPEALGIVANLVIEEKIRSSWKLHAAIDNEIRRLEDPSNPINYIEREMPAVHRYYYVANRDGPVSLDPCSDDLGLVGDSAIELLAADILRMHQSDFDRMCEVAEALAKHGHTRLKTVAASPDVLEQIAANAAARIAEKFV